MRIDYDCLAQEYARHRQVMPEVLRNLIEFGELGPSSQVLDVGCGTGNYAIALAEAAGCACWGLEPSERMLAEARQRSRKVWFQTGRAEHLDFPSESFDLVFSVDVIHHVGDRPAYLREAHRVLKRGGRVCTVTDSEEIIRHRRPLSVYFPETIDIELRRYPGIADLRAEMVRAGFADLHEALAERAYELTDIEKYRTKAFSCLHLIPPDAFERGIQRMERDLRDHPIPATSRYLHLWGTKCEDSATSEVW